MITRQTAIMLPYVYIYACVHTYGMPCVHVIRVHLLSVHVHVCTCTLLFVHVHVNVSSLLKYFE